MLLFPPIQIVVLVGILAPPIQFSDTYLFYTPGVPFAICTQCLRRDTGATVCPYPNPIFIISAPVYVCLGYLSLQLLLLSILRLSIFFSLYISLNEIDNQINTR